MTKQPNELHDGLRSQIDALRVGRSHRIWWMLLFAENTGMDVTDLTWLTVAR